MSYNVWTILTNEVLRPLVNRAVQGTYAPGSIFKIIVGLAALEAGWDPTKLITSPGYFLMGKERKGDTAPAGDYDFRRALKLSCNKYFVDAGHWVEVDRIVAMAQQFHFGEKTGFEERWRGEARGMLPTREWMRENRGVWYDDGDTANLSIGQGYVAVTPMQVAVMIAAVANGGTVFQPRLVERVESQDTLDHRPARTVQVGQLRSRVGVSAHTLEILHDAMRADVEDSDGTGRYARIAGFPIAAKTGTAQVKKGRVTVDHITWFGSFGPCDSPRYAVVVMIESGAGGGVTCGPVAKKIYQALIDREKTGFAPARSNLASK